jgi:hypothetical protein
MERDAERGVDWVHLPVIVTVARLLCRELTMQNEYLLLETGRSSPRSRAGCASPTRNAAA